MTTKPIVSSQRPTRALAAPKIGAPPGTLVAPAGARPTTVRVIDYNTDELLERDIETVAELKDYVERESTSWVDVVGLGDVQRIREIGKLFGLSTVVLEDILTLGQAPKFEDFDVYGFVLADLPSAGERLEVEQISLVFGPRFVVSFRERESDCFDPVRERISNGRKRIRTLGSDYLVYALLDVLVDSYYPVVKGNRMRLEEVEDRLSDGPFDAAVPAIHAIRRELRLLRRILEPMTVALQRMLRPELELVSKDTHIYLADCWENSRRQLEAIDAHRELCNDLFDLHMSQLSHKLNEVMKVLTIFSALFIPLTFVAGLYGMNFDPGVSRWNMPELGMAYGYPAALAAMLVLGIGLVIYFVRKGWIGGSD